MLLSLPVVHSYHSQSSRHTLLSLPVVHSYHSHHSQSSIPITPSRKSIPIPIHPSVSSSHYQ